MTEGAASGVGEALARARTSRGLALADVAQQLKFAPRHIEALEEERFESLPGGAFARGMVRSYARLLKLDPEPLLERIVDRFDAPDSDQLAARFNQPVPFSNSGRRSTLVYLGLSVGVLAMVAFAAYQWRREGAEPEIAEAPAKTNTAALSNPVPSAPPATRTPAAPAAPAPATVAPAPVTPPPPAREIAKNVGKDVTSLASLKSGQASAEASLKSAEASLNSAEASLKSAEAPLKAADAPRRVSGGRIVLRCEEESWIEVKDSAERTLISSLNSPGTERVVEGRPPFTLVIGNAQHVRVRYNDTPVDLAPHTKVEVARFTLE